MQKKLAILLFIMVLIVGCSKTEEVYDTTVCKATILFYEQDHTTLGGRADLSFMVRSRDSKVFYQFMLSETTRFAGSETLGPHFISDSEKELIREINDREGIFYSIEKIDNEAYERTISILEHDYDKLPPDSFSDEELEVLNTNYNLNIRYYLRVFKGLSEDNMHCQTY